MKIGNMKFKRHFIWIALLFLVAVVPPAHCDGEIDIVVSTILASSDGSFLDPRLEGQINELKNTFRYSSYRLLSIEKRRLKLQTTGHISLPGQRTMTILPLSIEGKRVRIKLNISGKGDRGFQTEIKLLNRSRFTVGGPQHEGGYLILNISAFF